MPIQPLNQQGRAFIHSLSMALVGLFLVFLVVLLTNIALMGFWKALLEALKVAGIVFVAFNLLVLGAWGFGSLYERFLKPRQKPPGN